MGMISLGIVTIIFIGFSVAENSNFNPEPESVPNGRGAPGEEAAAVLLRLKRAAGDKRRNPARGTHGRKTGTPSGFFNSQTDSRMGSPMNTDSGSDSGDEAYKAFKDKTREYDLSNSRTKTDKYGRPSKVSGTIRRVGPGKGTGTGTSGGSKSPFWNTVGGQRPKEVQGHIVGDMLGGSGSHKSGNLIPQNKKWNNSGYKKDVENPLKKFADARPMGAPVDVKFRPNYRGRSRRPNAISSTALDPQTGERRRFKSLRPNQTPTQSELDTSSSSRSRSPTKGSSRSRNSRPGSSRSPSPSSGYSSGSSSSSLGSVGSRRSSSSSRSNKKSMSPSRPKSPRRYGFGRRQG